MPAFFGYVTAQMVAKAYQKAGAVNKEKLIDALEGMTVDGTALGKLHGKKVRSPVALSHVLRDNEEKCLSTKTIL